VLARRLMHFFGPYCLLRFRWYVRVSSKAMLRYWQWLLLAALLVPGIPVIPLLSALATGLLTLVSPRLPMPIRLIGIAAVIVLAVLWVCRSDKAFWVGNLPPTLPRYRCRGSCVSPST